MLILVVPCVCMFTA